MPFLEIILLVLSLYKWVIIIGFIMSLLLVYNIINNSHPFVRTVYDFCARLTEPVYKHIRGVVKPINGIDLSPMILLLAIYFVQRCLVWYVVPVLTRNGL